MRMKRSAVGMGVVKVLSNTGAKSGTFETVPVFKK